MINIKKLSIIALSLLLVGVVGGLFTFSQAINKETKIEKKSISDEVTDVDVIAQNATVEIIPTTGTDTNIELESKEVKASKLNLSANVEGKKLTVTLKEKRSFSIFSIGFHIQSLHLKVYVPKKSYKSFVVKSDNGKVEMAELDIKSLNVESQNGQIELKDIISEKVEVNSANGNVDLNNVEGKLIGSSKNGKISLITKDLDRNIQLESRNANIMIKTDKEPTNTTLDVHSNNGGIDILNKYKGNVVIGKGENIVKLESKNGKIEIIK
jgi:DUF4097 and DUF4098 domain-containing protein YvlB